MNKYLQTLSLAIFILIGSLFFASPILTLYNFTHIEREEVEEDTLQVRNIIEDKTQQLNTTAGDYAGWDDAYAFMKDGNRKFIASSLGESFYSKIRLNLFCMVSGDGTLLYGRAYDLLNNKTLPVPKSFFPHIAPGSLLLKHSSPESCVRGFISLPEGLLMLVSRPILTSEYSGPPRGTLIIGRFFDQTETSRISKLLNYRVDVLNDVSSNSNSDYKTLLTQLVTGEDLVVRAVSKHLITGHVRLTDIYGRVAGIVRLEKPRTIYHQVNQTTFRMILLYVSMWLVVAFVFIIFRNKLTVVSRNKQAVKVQLDSFIELAADGIFSISSSGDILMVNTRVCEISGYSRTELLEMSLCHLFDSCLPQDIQLGELLREQGNRGIEHTLLRKDGHHLVVELSTKKMPDDTFQCIMHDVSNYKALEQQLIEHHDRISSMAIELAVVEERERNRIAGELHDQVGPNLLLAKLKVEQLQFRLPEAEFEEEFEAIKEFINTSVQDVRSLTFQLRPPILANAGLEAALRWLAQDFEQNHGFKVTVTHETHTIQLEYSIRLALFQAVRELLLNVAKHAAARQVRIILTRKPDHLEVAVEDDGCGFVVTKDFTSANSFGLFNTQQRIKYHGGHIHIDSTPGHGTTALITIPL